MSEGLVIETLYEVSIVFRKESFINAKKVLNFIQSLTNEKKVIKSLTALHSMSFAEEVESYFFKFYSEEVKHIAVNRLSIAEAELYSKEHIQNVYICKYTYLNM